MIYSHVGLLVTIKYRTWVNLYTKYVIQAYFHVSLDSKNWLYIIHFMFKSYTIIS